MAGHWVGYATSFWVWVKGEKRGAAWMEMQTDRDAWKQRVLSV